MTTKSRVFMLAALIGTAIVALPYARGQYWTEDTAFKPAIESDTDQVGTAYAIAYPGGKLLTGGTIINGKIINTQKLVRMNGDGMIDSTFDAPVGAGFLGAYPDGRILVGSHPQSGTSAFLIQRLLADGSVDPNFSSISVSYHMINALLMNDGRILIYGQFTKVGGVSQSGVALLQANGTLDGSFQSPFPANTSNEVINSAKPTADGQHIIIAGGVLNLGAGLGYIARLNLDGSIDAGFNAAPAGFSSILSQVYPDAQGGGMLVANGSGNMIHLTSSGALDSGFTPALVGSIWVFGPRQSDGKIFYLASGYVGNTYSLKLHRMNPDGSDDASFPEIATPYSSSYQIGFPVLSDDGTIFVGPMTADRAAAGLRLTHVLANGSIDPGFNPRYGNFGQIDSYVQQSDGKYLIIGTFDHINNIPMPQGENLVRLNLDGTLDSSFNATLPSGYGGGSLAIQPGGKILVYGGRGIRFGPDGSNDASFQPIPQAVYSVAVDSAGYIYGIANGQPQLVRYTPDGVLDPTFQAPTLGGLTYVTPLSDGALLAVSRPNYFSNTIIRLLHNGAIDTGFKSPDISNVVGLAALPDGNALLCEELNSPQFNQYHTIRRLLPDGTSNYNYTTHPDNGPGQDVRLALAGALFDLLRAAAPGANASASADFTQSAERMALSCRTDGQLTIRSTFQHDSNPFSRYQRTALASPSMDAAPFIIQGLRATSPQPLNSPYFGLSVTMGGVSPFAYQWLKDGVPITGQTSAIFHLGSVQASDAGNYSVTVSNPYGSVTTPAVTLAVDTTHALAAIVAQPSSQTVARGWTASFSVVAIGDPAITYQWSFNDSPIPGAIGPTLNLNNVQTTDAGNYGVYISNTVFVGNGVYGGFANSQVAVLTVINPSAYSPAGDFNGDGKSDFLWQNSVTGERALWLMNGINFMAASTLGVFPLEWTVAATGDFNGDGKPDIIWSNSITGERAIWLMNGTNLLAVSTLGVFPLEWTVAATGDFNGDGKPDIIWSNSITGERAIWLMNGTNFLAASTLGIFPLEWTVAATGDFNGDGKPDIVWSNSITGERAIWLMNGTNFLAASTLGVFPLEWTVAGIGDYNGDEKPDIIWSNSLTGERAVWLMNGTNFLAASTLGIFPLEWTVQN